MRKSFLRCSKLKSNVKRSKAEMEEVATITIDKRIRFSSLIPMAKLIKPRLRKQLHHKPKSYSLPKHESKATWKRRE